MAFAENEVPLSWLPVMQEAGASSKLRFDVLAMYIQDGIRFFDSNLKSICL